MALIEDLIVEMKDTSELMVDLAYSSLLYDSEAIAEEVYMLEDRMDELNVAAQREAIELPQDKALSVIRLAICAERIADAAMSIADVMLRDVELHPVLAMSIRDSNVIITKVRINEESALVGNTIGGIRLASETGMWTIAIRRGERWIFGPDKNTQLQDGDTLICKGPKEGVAHLKALASESGNR